MKYLIGLFTLLFLLPEHSYCQESESLAHFSKMFKADSNGATGFRKKNIAKRGDTVLIGGLNMKGYVKDKVLEILGSPNFISFDTFSNKKRYLYNYIYQKSYIRNSKTEYIYNGYQSIELRILDDSVMDVVVMPEVVF